ncbi:THAP domain-containing protein 1 [Monomorium pharaonis]|uniref:THAP domain-containing protein 1 n=1 Tax=Monomorium pharaonis TaxID=307658 RepID=UPI00063EDDE3|nr:THAP domain-containing protein 1 [Monomorium pharaonis]
MAGCCVPGCRNSTTKGFSVRSFPRDRERRRQWIVSIGVPNWQPNTNSRICEAHFAKNMWEKDRCDGKRKLKFNAIPTIFSHMKTEPAKKSNPVSSKNNNGLFESKNGPVNSTINMLIASLTEKGEVKIDHQYQLYPNNVEQLNQQLGNYPNASALISANEKETDWKKRCEELTRRLTRSENECERLQGVIKRREDLFNKLIKKSYNCGKLLKERLRKLRKEKEQLYVSLKDIFNEDQLRVLTNPTESCDEWCDDTIRRAIRLRLACNSVGYQEILKQRIPLPSEQVVLDKIVEIGI